MKERSGFRHVSPALPARKGSPVWLITFLDMAMLLLTFFVMLVSYASFDPSKAREIVVSLRGALGASTQPRFQVSLSRQVPSNITRRRVAGVQTEITQQVRHRGLLGRLQVSQTERGITVTLLDPLLFSPGSAAIGPDAYQLLDALADILSAYVNEVIITGHADDSQAATPETGTAWDLSAARARSVLEYFITRRSLQPERFSFAGQGAYRPYPESLKGLSAQERTTYNNRVEVQIIATDAAPAWLENIRDQRSIPSDDQM